VTRPSSRRSAKPPIRRPAVFLDRDGTIVDDPGFLRDPADVVLLPGVATAIAQLNRAGIAAVVVTNQSGIARGLILPEEYRAVEKRIEELLAAEGGSLDATYHCPHYPAISGPCECRKPGALLFRLAAEELGLDLARSWAVGDRLSDLEAVRLLGGRGILVRTGAGEAYAGDAVRAGYVVARDLTHAIEQIRGGGSPLQQDRSPP
jgi:D-glycero-D-manno-heptose 1,7-bisphosphate phosphatase